MRDLQRWSRDCASRVSQRCPSVLAHSRAAAVPSALRVALIASCPAAALVSRLCQPGQPAAPVTRPAACAPHLRCFAWSGMPNFAMSGFRRCSRALAICPWSITRRAIRVPSLHRSTAQRSAFASRDLAAAHQTSRRQSPSGSGTTVRAASAASPALIAASIARRSLSATISGERRSPEYAPVPRSPQPPLNGAVFSAAKPRATSAKIARKPRRISHLPNRSFLGPPCFRQESRPVAIDRQRLGVVQL